MGVTMRSYIFTEHERRILREWLRTGTELQGVRMLFSRIRLFNKLKEDLALYNEVIERLDK